MQSKTHLKFVCNENWNSFTPCDGGKFCPSCKTVVRDFAGKSEKEIVDLISSNKTKSNCGSFKAYQLQNPFGDWRDKLISAYQNVLDKKTIFKQAALFCFAILFVLSGCRRRLAGAYAYDTTSIKKQTKTTKELKK